MSRDRRYDCRIIGNPDSISVDRRRTQPGMPRAGGVRRCYRNTETPVDLTNGADTSVCPECGSGGAVLQSVTNDEWECRIELGGCGAVMDTPVAGAGEHKDAVQEGVRAMVEAIRSFEHQECPLGQPSLVEMERRTADLLETLKNEIGRLSTLVGDATD